jgi:hypothetical protein
MRGGSYAPYAQVHPAYDQWGSDIVASSLGYGLNPNIGGVSALANPMSFQQVRVM